MPKLECTLLPVIDHFNPLGQCLFCFGPCRPCPSVVNPAFNVDQNDSDLALQDS